MEADKYTSVRLKFFMNAPNLIVVTEFGIVDLQGIPTWQKAEALISIADPDFRDELIEAAEKQHIWRKSNKR